MVRATRLKVYRTPIGFHDAYVAAPSQKVALKAWGSAHDLFSTGEAELVTDTALTEAPLAEPGTIVRRVRGTTAEHIAALPAEPEAPAKPEAAAPPARPAPPNKPAKPRSPPKPRLPKPDQAAVVTAKAALKAALDEQALERRALKQREEALRREREALEAKQAAAAASLRETVEAAETAYRDALQKWQESRR